MISVSIGILIILAIVSVVQLQAQSVSESLVKIVFPKDKTYVTQKAVKVIGTVSDTSIQQVNIIVGEEPSEIVQVDKQAFEVAVNLQPGLNEISVSTVGHKKAITTKIMLFKKTRTNKAPKGFENYFSHPLPPKPIKISCQDCHEFGEPLPYDYKKLRKNPEFISCQTEECHADIGKEKYSHGPVNVGTCIACHNPHGSLNKHELRSPTLLLCLECHLIGSDINPLKQKYVHGPVNIGCVEGVCHDPHASPYKYHLRTFFSPEFYPVPSSLDNYELCFKCHDESTLRYRRITDKESHGELTRFRDGNLNLKYLHVIRERPRSCKACHDVHASNQPKHIRDEVPFGPDGQYVFPLVFVKTEDGGKCIQACHKDWEYNNAGDPLK
ncbi:hypothetical protein H8E77_08065 [bacterium]|nr:hypothetical protein [bacterium]